MTPEGKTKNAIKNWLIAHGIIPAAQVNEYLVRKTPFDGWYYMPTQGMYSVKGVPDFIICYRGRFIAIEAKAPQGSTTPNQDDQIEAIVQAGGRAFVVAGVGDLSEMLLEAA